MIVRIIFSGKLLQVANQNENKLINSQILDIKMKMQLADTEWHKNDFIGQSCSIWISDKYYTFPFA